ncbi:MAG TPA: Fic family protein [Candidatus Limnocylindrales bacterium]|nr:Fic family protein [Candidatus Limnocylindrales bacterium]
MDNLLLRLTKKKKQLDSHQPIPPELRKNIEEWLKVELTYSSNAIEGNTLTRIETAEVIERGITAVINGKPLKDQIEAINHAKALDFINQLARTRKSHQFITEKDILDIHKIILTGIDDNWAGKYRLTEVFIRGSNAEFPMPNSLHIEMRNFISWLQAQQDDHPVKIAADAHMKFVSIHPFIDGNGRTTRLLMNLILLLNGYPMGIIRNEERTAYLNSFESAQNKKDMQPFYTIIFTSVERSLDIYLNALSKKNAVFKEFETQPQEELLKIGSLAKKTGETIHTLRFWTKEGLLNAKDHTPSGYQLYEHSAIDVVKRIRQLQLEKRLTIEEIKKVLREEDNK